MKIYMKKLPLVILLCVISFAVSAQIQTKMSVAKDTTKKEIEKEVIKKRENPDELKTMKLSVQGKVYSAMVTEEGDTLILADLDDISITSFRTFDNDEDYRKYQKFKRYAAKVFPYAKEAIRIFREYEYASEHMSRRQRKRKLKELEKQLNEEFEEPLKKFTKLQGKIMMKMIEKELDASMYDLIRGLKGRFTAFYWHNFSKLYSYDMKEGYNRGQYKILDAVLDDFDVSYRIESNSSLKYIKLEDMNRLKSKK